MLNLIWISFFGLSFAIGLFEVLSHGNLAIFSAMISASFHSAKESVDIALGLIGVLSLWMGLFRIAEEAGVVKTISRILSPFFHQLMPEVPLGHDAIGSVSLNISANILGLDNAATPMGLRAMSELQEINPSKDVATNAQILFLVINSASVTLIPVSVFMYRAQMGATNPTSVFIPIIISTFTSALVGMLSVAFIQRINLFNRIIGAYFIAAVAAMTLITTYFMRLPGNEMDRQSTFFGNFILFAIILFFIGAGIYKKLDVFSCFIEGAKQGFQIAVKIIPYLVAMLVSIGIFRASGGLGLFVNFVGKLFAYLGFNTDFVPALSTAFMKPLSGSGARAMMLDTMKTYGVDSFPALVSAVIQGSTETTFYVITVYFGSVGIKNFRYAILCGLLADFAGIIAAIVTSYYFFHR
ncbi:MAG: nucleoside recognition domain-containing protein [Pseudobdellovibrionaceae bacterium]